MIDRKDWPVDARNAQDAFDEASWDAIEGYRGQEVSIKKATGKHVDQIRQYFGL